MTIGIIGAMDEEVDLLQKSMEETKTEKVAGNTFITGRLRGKHVVVLQSGIGKVNAAVATTILQERFNPSLVINTGSAGGFAPQLQVGDLVISSKVTHHDVDVTAFDYEYGQVPGMPAMYEADHSLVELAMEATKELASVQAVKGIIATGDSFMQDENKIEFVRSKFPNMIAAEMEAAAIAQVCFKYETPFVIVRALSDIAGKESSVSFDAFLETAATNAANLIMSMVSKL
ncbi:5'-methylthioadenosine/S-adenosylhomocysteine nucleosidase [Radiobacillus kanasensis]|uniref:5'-methylthioadenosine/S-adenosylhomocysteine nucleosidase n=1 Tax=Radiobacillus kanasensis TaxID=2844358 RepID=UPI001E34462B|nr:5'-methylthioadenosine/S-adenosylhomocysteine nucleosidase [Radiobacillus kanasensis]UFT97858.1 5'-methylthioadenosine/S-adenosylhomocysteine nucleosidase [Radiobacillus kanasensis]